MCTQMSASACLRFKQGYMCTDVHEIFFSSLLLSNELEFHKEPRFRVSEIFIKWYRSVIDFHCIFRSSTIMCLESFQR